MKKHLVIVIAIMLMAITGSAFAGHTSWSVGVDLGGVSLNVGNVFGQVYGMVDICTPYRPEVVYVEPVPVYVQPAPVCMAPPVYVQRTPVYVAPAPVIMVTPSYGYGDYYERQAQSQRLYLERQAISQQIQMERQANAYRIQMERQANAQRIQMERQMAHQYRPVSTGYRTPQYHNGGGHHGGGHRR